MNTKPFVMCRESDPTMPRSGAHEAVTVFKRSRFFYRPPNMEKANHEESKRKQANGLTTSVVTAY